MAEVRKTETDAGLLRSHEDRLRRVEALASRAPSQSVGVELAGQYVEVTSATFVPTCHWNLPAAFSDVLNAWVAVTSDASTTGEVRIREAVSGAVTDILTIPALANQSAYFEWLHGVHLGDTTCEFQIQARRTGGSGNINVYSPRRFLLDTAIRFPNADTAGNATLF